MKSLLTRLGWPLLIIALVLCIYLLGKTRPVAVEIAEVRRGPVAEYVTEEARTQLHTERVVTADRPGTVRRITLEEGDPVAVGQVLTAIEDTELKLTLEIMGGQLEEIEGRLAGVDVPLPKDSEIAAAQKERLRAEAGLDTLSEERKAAEAELQYAEAEYGRIEKLRQSETATDQQHDQAQSRLQVARAGLEALKHRSAAAQLAVEIASLRQQVLQESLQDTAHLRQVYAAQKKQVQKSKDLLSHEAHVRCPIDGVVLEKYVDSEQYVQPGTPLLKVGDMRSIEIRADILSDEVGRVRPGQEVLLVGKAISNPFATGRVKKIYPSGFTKISSLGVRQQRVAVLVDFDSSELDLGPGYELDVKIVAEAKDDVVLVPSAAVFATAEGAAVLVVEDGRARLRRVGIGLRGEDFYEVSEGLDEGELVILRPPSDLEEGRRVKARPQ